MSTVFHDCGKTTQADGAVVTNAASINGGNTGITASNSSSGVKRILADVPPGDTACYEIAAQTGTAAYWQLNSTLTGGGGSCGAWVYLTAVTGSHQFMRFGNSGSNYLGVNATNHPWITINNLVVYTSTQVLAPNRWYWMSHSVLISATVGQSKMGLWDAHGVLLDSYTSAATLNTSAVTSANSLYGKISASNNSPVLRFAAFRVADVIDLIPPVRPPGVRGWGTAA